MSCPLLIVSFLRLRASRMYTELTKQGTQKISESQKLFYMTLLQGYSPWGLDLWAVFKSMHRHSEGHGSVRRRSPVTASCGAHFGLYIGNARSRETLLSHIISLLRQDYNYSKLGAFYAPSRQSLHYVPELPDRAVSVIWEAFCNGGSRHRNALAHSLWSVTLDRRISQAFGGRCCWCIDDMDVYTWNIMKLVQEHRRRFAALLNDLLVAEDGSSCEHVMRKVMRSM